MSLGTPEPSEGSLALVEARLRGNDCDLALLLDTGELRLLAAMLADMLARFIADYADDPLEALARLRPVLMRAGDDPPPDAQPVGLAGIVRRESGRLRSPVWAV